MDKVNDGFKVGKEDIYNPLKGDSSEISGVYVVNIVKEDTELVVTFSNGTTTHFAIGETGFLNVKNVTYNEHDNRLAIVYSDDTETILQLKTSITGLAVNNKKLSITYSDGSTNTLNIDDLLSFSGDNDSIVILRDNVLTISSSKLSDFVNKEDDNDFNGDNTFNGNSYLSNLKFLADDPLSSPILHISDLTAKGDSDTSTLMTKHAILKLFGSFTGGGINITGNANNIPVINTDGDGLVDSLISKDNLFLLNTKADRVVTDGNILFDNIDIQIKESLSGQLGALPKGNFSLSNGIKVKYILDNISNTSFDKDKSLVTAQGVENSIAQAQLNSVTFTKSVISALPDYPTGEPASPSQGDRYIINIDANETSTLTGQTIPKNSIIEWEGTGTGWIITPPVNALSTLNRATGTFWRVVQDSNNRLVWEDPNSGGISSHDDATDVRDSDGVSMATPSQARHLNSQETDLLLKGGTVSTEHTHAPATATRPGSVPALPLDSSKFLNGEGEFVSMADINNVTDLQVEFDTDTTSPFKKVSPLSNGVSGFTVGNVTTLNCSWIADVTTRNWVITDITFPKEEYTTKITITNSYGEYFQYIVSTKNPALGAISSVILLNKGVDGKNCSINVQVSTDGKTHSIESNPGNTHRALHEAYGDPRFYCHIELIGYSGYSLGDKITIIPRADVGINDHITPNVSNILDGAVGEANYGLNIGEAGTGIYKEKTNSVLTFKKLNSISEHLTINDSEDGEIEFNFDPKTDFSKTDFITAVQDGNDKYKFKAVNFNRQLSQHTIIYLHFPDEMDADLDNANILLSIDEGEHYVPIMDSAGETIKLVNAFKRGLKIALMYEEDSDTEAEGWYPLFSDLDFIRLAGEGWNGETILDNYSKNQVQDDTITNILSALASGGEIVSEIVAINGVITAPVEKTKIDFEVDIPSNNTSYLDVDASNDILLESENPAGYQIIGNFTVKGTQLDSSVSSKVRFKLYNGDDPIDTFNIVVLKGEVKSVSKSFFHTVAVGNAPETLTVTAEVLRHSIEIEEASLQAITRFTIGGSSVDGIITRNYIHPVVDTGNLELDFAGRNEVYATKDGGGAIVINEDVEIAYTNYPKFDTAYIVIEVQTETRTITFPENHKSGDFRWENLVLTLDVGFYQLTISNNGAYYSVLCSQPEL